MVETITPAVHGGRRSKYWVTIALHALGATLAAGAFGLGLGVLGALLGAPWDNAGPIAIAVVAVVYAAREAFRLPIPIPDRHRQVPAWWRTFYSPPVASFLYGVGLGIGYLTFLSFGTFVAVTVAAIATGDPLLALALIAPFGLARGLAVAVGSGAVEAGPSSILDRLDQVKESRGPRLVNAAALVALAATSAATLI